MKSVITRHIFELRISWPAPQAGKFEIYNFEKIQMGVMKWPNVEKSSKVSRAWHTHTHTHTHLNKNAVAYSDTLVLLKMMTKQLKAKLEATSRDKINWKNPWRLFSPWENREPIGGQEGDPSWVPKFKENEMKKILAQNGSLELFKPMSLLIMTLPTFMS